jgi:hypothetical protein
MGLQIFLLLFLLSSVLAQIELSGTGIIWALEGENWVDITLDNRVGCLTATARYTGDYNTCGIFSLSNNTLLTETGVCSFADPSSPVGLGRAPLGHALECTSNGEYVSFVYFLVRPLSSPFIFSVCLQAHCMFSE